MVLCTAYFSFFSEKDIRGLKDFMDLGIQFYKHDTSSAKTEVLSKTDCLNGVHVRKEKILYGVGNWRLFTKAEASAIINNISKKLLEKYSDEDVIKDEKYEIKNDVATE